MGISVGVDVQAIDEVATSLREFGSRYTNRLFTDHEIDDCGRAPSVTATGLAARFAAKEAVLKILDTTEIVPRWKAIEVHRAGAARHEIILSEAAADLAARQGVRRLSLGLACGAGFAVATVVAEVDGPKVASP